MLQAVNHAIIIIALKLNQYKRFQLQFTHPTADYCIPYCLKTTVGQYLPKVNLVIK